MMSAFLLISFSLQANRGGRGVAGCSLPLAQVLKMYIIFENIYNRIYTLNVQWHFDT
jgi:hypothetical protein